MNQTAPQEQSIVDMLEPLREPAVPSAWPPAPGWWILAAILLALCVLLLRRLWAWHKRGEPVRESRRRLDAIRAADVAPQEKLAALAQLQRQLAIRIAGRERCAGLTGAAWADFLNTLGRDDESYFDATLWDAAYRPSVDATDVEDALARTGSWLDTLERPA